MNICMVLNDGTLSIIECMKVKVLPDNNESVSLSIEDMGGTIHRYHSRDYGVIIINGVQVDYPMNIDNIIKVILGVEKW